MVRFAPGPIGFFRVGCLHLPLSMRSSELKTASTSLNLWLTGKSSAKPCLLNHIVVVTEPFLFINQISMATNVNLIDRRIQWVAERRFHGRFKLSASRTTHSVRLSALTIANLSSIDIRFRIFP